MSGLLGSSFLNEVKGKLRINQHKINIENRAFRLFSKLTVAILILCCGLVTLQQLVGEHIRCLVPPKEDVRPEALAQYCFIMSTYTLPHLANGTVGVDVVHPGVGGYDKDEHDTKYHAYYQWVPFMLFFQALFFVLPHIMWKAVEGGVLKAYCTLEIADKITLKHRAIIDENGADGKKRKENKEAVLSRAAEYFIAHMHHNRVYAYSYVVAEILNFVIVITNIFLTDAFLGYEFSTYGPDVVKFLSQDPENRIDPMNRVFPKVTKCDFHKYGPSGSLINYDVMCVLALNIINEKIYTFLWFWFVIMSIIGGLALIYRIVTIFVPSLRNGFIRSKVLEADHDALEMVTEKLSFCDWFVLKRLSDNINRLRFGELVQSIATFMPSGSRLSIPPFQQENEKEKYAMEKQKLMPENEYN